MPDSLETRIAQVLAEHREDYSEHCCHWHDGCSCGWDLGDESRNREGFAAHVAAEIARALGAETRVEWGLRAKNGEIFGGYEDQEFTSEARIEGDALISRTVTTVPPLVGDWQETEQ